MAEREQDIEHIKELTFNLNELASNQYEKVASQSASLDAAERNIIKTSKETKKANVQLTKAKENSKKSSRTMLKLVCIALLVVLLILVFLIWELLNHK